MPRAKKTPSGKWRCVIYDYKDSTGKVHQKIFTAETKREAERMAIAYKEGPQLSDLVVGEAVKKYIDSKEPVISPSTHRSYMSIYHMHYETTRFGAVRLVDLDNITIQRFVSDLGVGAKTVSNIYGLLSAALQMFMPERKFTITLPHRKRPELYTPTTAEVEELMEIIKEDRNLYNMVLLCTYGPVRRSEACAVRYDDIDQNTNAVTIRRACVRNDYKQWIYKEMPKTDSSYRTIIYPPEVVKTIGRGFGYVIDGDTPAALSDRYARARDRAGLPHFRLHDLRHYAASILHAIGIPDQYIMARGGWKTDHVMKRVYRDTLSDIERTMNEKINDHFSQSLAK